MQLTLSHFSLSLYFSLGSINFLITEREKKKDREENHQLGRTGACTHWASLKPQRPGWASTQGHGEAERWEATSRIPGMVEPGGLPSMGSHRVEHDWRDLAAAAAARKRKEGRMERWKKEGVGRERSEGREGRRQMNSLMHLIFGHPDLLEGPWETSRKKKWSIWEQADFPRSWGTSLITESGSLPTQEPIQKPIRS